MKTLRRALILALMTVIVMAPAGVWAVAPAENPGVTLFSLAKETTVSPKMDHGKTIAGVRRSLEKAPYDAIIAFNSKGKKVFEEARVMGSNPAESLKALRVGKRLGAENGALVFRQCGVNDGIRKGQVVQAALSRVKSIVVIYNDYTLVLTAAKKWPKVATISRAFSGAGVAASEATETVNGAEATEASEVLAAETKGRMKSTAKALGLKLKIETNRYAAEEVMRTHEDPHDPQYTERISLGENFFEWARNAWRLPYEAAGMFRFDSTLGTELAYTSFSGYGVCAGHDSEVSAEYRRLAEENVILVHTHPQTDNPFSLADVRNMVAREMPAAIVVTQGRIYALIKEDPTTRWATVDEAEQAYTEAREKATENKFEAGVRGAAEKCGLTFKTYPLTTIFPTSSGEFHTGLQRDMGALAARYRE